MDLKLFNTLTRKKEIFKPIKKNHVGIYCCGPTVYNYAHIGNLRTYVFEDILKRIFLYNHYKVKHVMNITDVGHLTSDADSGEDKLVKALKREGKQINKQSMLELADYYTKAFKDDIEKLNILQPNIWCKATDHIQDMLDLIKKIEKNNFTYKTKVGLIYNTLKFKDYTKLSKLKLKDLKQGSRVEADPERKNPSDFALWITNQPSHIMQWDSKFGRGFPGWHIECSAMSMKYLGEHFDIHCGGIDHIQIHHTNEIAQSEAATGKKCVNYWIHGVFLVIDKKKMAKSGENFITLQTLIAHDYSPLDYRYLCLNSHYSKPLNFSYQSLDSARNAFNNLKEKIKQLLEEKSNKKNKTLTYSESFKAAINDDLNTPQALAVLWDLIKDNNINPKEKYKLILKFDKVFGLKLNEIKIEKVSKNIKDLIKEREKARKEKDYKKADMIRSKLDKLGIILEDTEKGVKWKNK